MKEILSPGTAWQPSGEGGGRVSAAVRAGGRPAARSTAPPAAQSAHWLLSLCSVTGAFTPFAVSLGLLLVMTSAFPTPGPLGEDFKNDTTPGRLLLTTPEKTEALIKRMVDKISAMRKEVGRLAPG